MSRDYVVAMWFGPLDRVLDESCDALTTQPSHAEALRCACSLIRNAPPGSSPSVLIIEVPSIPALWGEALAMGDDGTAGVWSAYRVRHSEVMRFTMERAMDRWADTAPPAESDTDDALVSEGR